MSLTEAPVAGKDCKFYYNSGTHATPVWVEIDKAINVSANLVLGLGGVWLGYMTARLVLPA